MAVVVAVVVVVMVVLVMVMVVVVVVVMQMSPMPHIPGDTQFSTRLLASSAAFLASSFARAALASCFCEGEG